MCLGYQGTVVSILKEAVYGWKVCHSECVEGVGLLRVCVNINLLCVVPQENWLQKYHNVSLLYTVTKPNIRNTNLFTQYLIKQIAQCIINNLSLMFLRLVSTPCRVMIREICTKAYICTKFCQRCACVAHL